MTIFAKDRWILLNGILALIVASLAIVPTISAAAAAPITGIVFRDHDQDGERDARDVGLEGVTVVALDAAGVEAGRATTGSDGSYSLSGTDDAIEYRLTIEWTETHLRASAIGTDNGSTTRFANGGDVVDFSLSNPADFCATNAATVEYATSCFVNGDPTTADAYNATIETIVSEVQSSGVASSATKFATAAETGSVYGLAWQPTEARMFAASYVKRHVALGPGGINAIYSIEGSTVSTWYDAIDTDPSSLMPDRATRALPDDSGDSPASLDAGVFGLIGKIGFGDIDMSEDEAVLFAANLGDRNIYAIDVAAADGGSTTAHTSLGAPALSCSNGVARPFAVAVRDGVLYAGYTCTGETGGSITDVTGNVFAYDLGTDTWATTPSLVIPFDYADGCTISTNGCANFTWEDTFSYANFNFTADTSSAFEQPLRSQPILADIEFDTDGSMIIGVRDRQSDQFGHRNLTPNGDGNLLTSVNNGDMLRAEEPATPGGAYTLESAGVSGTRTSAGTGTTNRGEGGPAAPQGPGGGEFYWNDFAATSSNAGFHSETIIGGLAQVAGASVTATSITDPLFDRLDAGGIAWADLDDGTHIDALELYRDASSPAPSTFGKANGLGDVEALCGSAPVQIGNRVWFDRDGDGVQDPGEEPIPGVTVMLVGGGSVVTDANGVWSLFVDPATTYTVMVDPSTADVSGIAEVGSADELSPTSADQGDDEFDSDIDPLTYKVDVTTGAPGEHNHSIDAGFVPADLEIGNLVWLDLDNDGVAEDGEPGIAGVTVELYEDADLDGTKETFVDDTITDSNGNYRFTALPSGAYGVLIPDQSGVGEPLEGMWSSTPTTADPDDDVDNDDNGIDPSPQPDALMSGIIDLVGAEPLGETARRDVATIDAPGSGVADADSNLTVDFGFYPVASIGDRVWFDDDRNGVQDSGETGVSGVTVNLCNSAGVVVDTTTTAGDGTYRFDGLAPGEYKVCFDLSTLPADHVATDPDAGGDDAVDSDADDITGMTAITTLTAGEEDLTWDLGIYEDTTIYEVGNLVWRDDDNDGMAEDGEPGLSGVVVEIYEDDGSGNKGALVATTATDAIGQYRFTKLDAGDYLINIPDQSAAGQVLHGLRSSQPTEPDPNTDVDGDDNGIDPAADLDGVMSASVTLGGDAEPLAETLRKDDATAEATSSADERSNLTVDFGFFPAGSLGSTIWFDADLDGQRDPAEDPVPGVTVGLCTPDGTVLETTVTDASGEFLFDGLAPGDYKICIDLDTLPDGATFTTQNVGDDATDSDVDQTGMSDVVTLGIGEDDLTTYAGLVPPAAIGDTVWFDADADGVQGGDEPGISGVTVELCDTELNPLESTITDDDGNYLFDGLTPGDYVICFDLATLPADRIPTTTDAGVDDAADSDADRVTGQTDVITLDPGETDLTVDLGAVSSDATLPVTGTSLTGMFFGFGLLIAGAGVGLLALDQRRRFAV